MGEGGDRHLQELYQNLVLTLQQGIMPWMGYTFLMEGAGGLIPVIPQCCRVLGQEGHRDLFQILHYFSTPCVTLSGKSSSRRRKISEQLGCQ